MKKILAVWAILTISLTACADHHQLVEYSDLPAQAQVFIQKYFNVTDVAYIERERDGVHHEYQVHLKNDIERIETGNALESFVIVLVELISETVAELLPSRKMILGRVGDNTVKVKYKSLHIAPHIL